MTPPQPPTFVLPTPVRAAERHGAVDLYPPDPDLSDSAPPRPAVVLVHGGPVPAEVQPTPRDWPLFRGYGSAIAERGAVAVTVDHGLHTLADYPDAAGNVAAAVDAARADPRVDADRVALWFFSGGSLLMADWLRRPPAWLRCVAATYPVMAPLPDWTVDARFRPVDAVADAGPLPIVLTRVGKERPDVAASVEDFVSAARAGAARLQVIDVPGGQHGFDMLDHTDESRDAVRQAIESVISALT